jgi:flavorubredoxin
MKQLKTLYSDDSRAWAVLARDPARREHLVDTNEYLVTSAGRSLICDPGGVEIFPAVFASLTDLVDPATIDFVFASHQDPDVISSLPLWLELNPKMRCYTSSLWTGFIAHQGGEASSFVPIPDEGTAISIGRAELQAIPAHYLHSPGNFHLYDRTAKILFSGEVGGALMPGHAGELFVERFDTHIPFMEGFHRRWMGSNEAKNAWCDRVGALAIDMLCPQRGAIFRGKDVERFIEWLRALRVGVTRNSSETFRAA